MISILIPVYNEEENIKELYHHLLISLKSIPHHKYEIIFIDDGSYDNSFQKFEELRQNDNNIKIICLSRNFGHQMALTAGLDFAEGDAVIMMDADLQHPPELLSELVKKWEEGYDIVYTIRKNVKDWGWFKKTTSKIFYWVLNMLSSINLPEGAADFRLISKEVVKNLRRFKERTRFMRGLINWIGYKKFAIPYTASNRFSGSSKYSLRKQITFALDGITSFSSFPLYLSGIIGVVVAAIGFLYLFYAIIMKIFSNKTIPGWTSIIVILLLLGGTQLITLGIIGLYLGKIYVESKQRPLYIIQKKIGFEQNESE